MKIIPGKTNFAVLLFSALNTFSNFESTAQTVQPNQIQNNARGCGTPLLPQNFESWVQGLTMPQGRLTGGQIQSVYNIPVIVHVIHNNEALNSTTATTGGNLNAAQVIDQINILNEDYNGRNSDTSLIPTVFKPLLGKFQFNFCLAVVNPTGGVLSEPGIERINRISKSWTAPPYSQSYINSTIKPNSIWDPSRYLNMWVMNLGGGLLGFATFPNPGTSGLSGLSPPYGSTTSDGLVMLNTAFGSMGTAVSGAPYNLGRTATHELGHWLGLRHIWGDGTCLTDYCADTPPAQNANYGCPTHPYKLGTCTGNTTGEMTMNYMDYTDDACMYMFSNDQKVRAQLIMTNSPLRASLLTSTVCNLPTVTNEIGIMYVTSPTYSQVISCNNFITPVVIMHNFGSNTLSTATYSYNVDGVNTATMAWNGTLTPGNSATVTLPTVGNLANGSHFYNVGVYSPNGSSDPYMLNNYNNQQFVISGSFTLTATGPASLCAGNSGTYTASGGASSYTWLPGSTTGTVVVFTAPTTFTLRGSLASCINTRTVSIGIIPLPTLTVNSPSFCSGSSTVLSVTGACNYTWVPGSFTGTSLSVNPGSTSQYTVIGSCNGCSSTRVATVTVVSLPVLTLNVSPTGSLCSGGTATVTATGATNYTWAGFGTINPLVVSPTVNTSYTVTGANGACMSTSNVIVFVGSNTLNIGISPATTSLCAGSTLNLVASGASSYTWNGGSNGNILAISPASNTSYTVNGTNGVCTSSAVIQATVVTNPTISLVANPSGSTCAGETVTITASGAQTYSWSNAGSTAQIIVNPTITTAYTATGNSLGCDDNKVHTVTIGASTLGLIVSSSAPTICSGASATISAVGLSTYTWNTGANSPSIVVSPTVNATYTLTGENGPCPAMAMITLTVLPAPQLSFAVLPSATLCPGHSATITASGGYSAYSWLPSGNGQNISIAPSSNTNYTAFASGSPNGCAAIGTVEITMSPNPVSVVSGTNTSCIDSNCNGIVNAGSSGGTAPYTYNLTNSTCTVLPCTNLCAGLYKLVTTDALGCTSFNFFSIACIPVNTTGLQSGERSIHAHIYPNPAHDQVNIDCEGEFAYEVFNCLGQLLREDIQQKDKAVIDLREFASGIYMISITRGEERLTRKIMVE